MSKHENTTTAEDLEHAEKYVESARKSAMSGFFSVDNCINIVSYTMANYFMQRLTRNDRADVNFITLIVQYSLGFGLLGLVRWYLTANRAGVEKIIDVVLYESVKDIFSFFSILAIVVIVRLIQDYFEFGIEDVYSVGLIFFLFSFFARLGSRLTRNSRF